MFKVKNKDFGYHEAPIDLLITNTLLYLLQYTIPYSKHIKKMTDKHTGAHLNSPYCHISLMIHSFLYMFAKEYVKLDNITISL